MWLRSLTFGLMLVGASVPAIGETSDRADESQAGIQAGWAGAFDGIRQWRLPDTANGLHPTQSWHATGSGADGGIYVAGMDHVTNSALYRIDSASGRLGIVGDARSASENAGNWRPGETAQKFHTRPLWYEGRVYVATMDRSGLDDDYLTRRGFHWYAYDPSRHSFSDLSASEPGGTGAPHGSLVTLAGDPRGGVIYGAAVPTGDLYRYDLARGRTEALGRPASYGEPYVYTGRVMWVDGRGRLYFTASNRAEASVHDHVHYYDPQTGFGEEKGWTLRDGQALETGRCIRGGRSCVFADDRGHVYRFEQDTHAWTEIGQVQVGKPMGPRATQIWLFAVKPDGSGAYVGTSTSPDPSEDTALFAFDFLTGETRRLCAMADLGPHMAHLHVHTGYDAWDEQGRFYFTSFDGTPERGVVVTRIDPARFEADLARRAGTK